MQVLPDDLIAALLRARHRSLRKAARRRIHVGDAVWPILREWPGGFALDARQVTQLRGLVGLYQGGRQIASCLIVASEIDGTELICAVKSHRPIADRPALDFELPDSAPTALLPRY